MQDTWVRSLGREDPWEEEIATHSSIVGWEIPWTEEPGRLRSRGSPRVRPDLATKEERQQVQKALTVNPEKLNQTGNAGNNDSKAQDVVRRIKEDTLNDQVEFLYCDLASMRSIREFVQTFKMKKLPLHVLVNNAGVMMVPQRTTEDGFEEHFGVNYLGHFLLTNLLLDTLQESGAPGRSARVVTVSSATHYVGELNLDDLQSSASYSAHAAYAQSKLALVLFTYHLQALLSARGVPVTASVADPGVVDTDLYRHVFWGTRLVKKLLGWWVFKTPDEGAWTSVYAAVTPALEGLGGRYLYNERETRSLEATYDPELQRQLWARSCQLTGITDVTQETFGE